MCHIVISVNQLTKYSSSTQSEAHLSKCYFAIDAVLMTVLLESGELVLKILNIEIRTLCQEYLLLFLWIQCLGFGLPVSAKL